MSSYNKSWKNPFVSIYEKKKAFLYVPLIRVLKKSCKMIKHLNGTVDVKKKIQFKRTFVFTLNVYLKSNDFVHKVQ